MSASSARSGWADPATVARVVLTVVAVLAAIGLLYLLRQPLGWLFLATFLAIAVSGPVAFFSRFLPRGGAIAITYLLLLLVPIALGLAIVPSVVSGVQSLVDAAPRLVREAQAYVEGSDWLRGIEDEYGVMSELQQKVVELPKYAGGVASWLGTMGLGLVNSGFALVNIILMSVFLVSGGPRWARAFLARQEVQHAERVERVLVGVAQTVGNYVMGALGQALIAGILTWIVLLILGVPYAAGLAAVTFVFDLIPLVGATIAAALVGIVTLFSGFPETTIIWVIWAVIYQQVENNIIQPQIQRKAVAVEPIIVLISVLCGASLAGILGAILAIPVAASIQLVFKEWRAMVAAARDRPLPPDTKLVDVDALVSEQAAPPPAAT